MIFQIFFAVILCIVVSDIIKYFYLYLNNEEVWNKLRLKWVVITNATSKMGIAFANHVANRGCNLIITDINEEGLSNLKKKLEKKVRVDYYKLDYSEDIDYSFLKKYDIGLLINKIGYFDCEPRTFIESNLNNFLIHNIKIPLDFLKNTLEIYIKNNFGYIINIGFDYSEKPRPFFAMINSVKSMYKTLSENLYYELKGYKVIVEYMECGSVTLDDNLGNFFSPNAYDLTKSIFSMFGNSFYTIPYFSHFLKYLLLRFVPKFVIARYRKHQLPAFGKRVKGLF